MLNLYDEIGEAYVQADNDSNQDKRADKATSYLYTYLFSRAAEIDVADIGCGEGNEIAILAETKPRTIVGVDPSEYMLQLARCKLGNPDMVQFGSWEHLPFQDRSKDVLCGRFSIHYVDDLSQAYRESARVLRSDGRMIFSTGISAETDINNNQPVTLKLFENRVTVMYPRRTMGDFLENPIFKEYFCLEECIPYHTTHATKDGQPNVMIVRARKKY